MDTHDDKGNCYQNAVYHFSEIEPFFKIGNDLEGDDLVLCRSVALELHQQNKVLYRTCGLCDPENGYIHNTNDLIKCYNCGRMWIGCNDITIYDKI